MIREVRRGNGGARLFVILLALALSSTEWAIARRVRLHALSSSDWSCYRYAILPEECWSWPPLFGRASPLHGIRGASASVYPDSIPAQKPTRAASFGGQPREESEASTMRQATVRRVGLIMWLAIACLWASSARADGDLSKVNHIIIVMQENHSFDNYFGVLPYASGTPK